MNKHILIPAFFLRNYESSKGRAIAVPYQGTPNVKIVKDMLAESPAKESKAVVADRIPKLPKNPHWAVKA